MISGFTRTDGKVRALIDEMKQAKNYIHLQYYIIRNDELWKEIEKVLIRKPGRAWKYGYFLTVWDAEPCITKTGRGWRQRGSW